MFTQLEEMMVKQTFVINSAFDVISNDGICNVSLLKKNVNLYNPDLHRSHVIYNRKGRVENKLDF